MNEPLKPYTGSGYFKSLARPRDVRIASERVRLLLQNNVRHLIALLRSDPEGYTVTEISQFLKYEQPNTSALLARLRRADLVYAERAGKHIYYHPNMHLIGHINEKVKEFFNEEG